MNRPIPKPQQLSSIAHLNQIDRQPAWIVWLDRIKLTDFSLVGGKNASLGEMMQSLNHLGVKVPPGFAITTFAYRQFLAAANLKAELSQILTGWEPDDVEELKRRSSLAQALILQTPFPVELEDAIKQVYSQLCQQYGYQVDVAVRSSATAEDLPHASFAGQQETYLNISGAESLMEAC